MKSYARGPVLPLLEKTIGQVLADSVAGNPSGDAIISRHQNLRLSYRDLEEGAHQTARGLWGLGIRPGDRGCGPVTASNGSICSLPRR